MYKALQFITYLILISVTTNGAIKLPKIFTNNMVLQRDKKVSIWGWADKGEKISVSFHGQQVKTKADKDGKWTATLIPMTYGGPFEMTIAGKKDQLTLKNILIGDVWICSGQSNMEWILKNTKNAAKEIAESNYPNIRLYTVEKATSFKPTNDLAGGEWLECNPANSGTSSAVAYFFGRTLNKELNVPIGLINSSWGGTNIQTWMSWDVMSQKEQYKNLTLAEMNVSVAETNAKKEKFAEALKNDKGLSEKWFDPSTSTSGWKKMKLPQLGEGKEVGNADGIVWFRKDIELPASIQAKQATIGLGPVDDIDQTYVNGKLVGSLNIWDSNRVYTLDAGLLHAGINTVVVKCIDGGGGGGICGSPEQLFITDGTQKISLAGEWLYKPAALTTEFGIKDNGPNSFPSLLYNAMIAPIIHYAIKGGIWYQGEANTGEAYRYRKLFPEMINDWRAKWNDSFPFFWVQLANFMAPAVNPGTSEWAELREAQSMTLSLPATGQAVIIDIGEEKDIHPRNKLDVGYRLAQAALKVAYGKNNVYSGPVYNNMHIEGNKISLYFSNTGSGLVAKDKYHYLKGFAIAGSDQQFVWAKALIEGDHIVVYSDDVSKPVAVRYAWGDNPDDANLYNKEGLPASPAQIHGKAKHKALNKTTYNG
jgi:sialate O-acetylesterase